MLLTRDLSIDVIDCEAPPRDATFTPLPQLARHLTVLRASVPHLRVPGLRFDVSSIPHAEIDLEVYLQVEYKLSLPGAWRSVKPHIPSIVSDDIRRYEVTKPHRDVKIRRPSLIEHPDYIATAQAHTRSVDIDMQEQAQMNLYYRARRY